MIKLGLWQIHRGKEKIQLQKQLLIQQTRPALNLNTISTPLKPYTKVNAFGSFDSRYCYLLMNKFRDHILGYEVLNLFLLDNDSKPVLINRGWIKKTKKNQSLACQVPTHTTPLSGWLSWPKKSFYFKEFVSNLQKPNKPQKLQSITPEFLQRQHWQPYILMSDQSFSQSISPIKRINAKLFSPHKHFAYAFQWFTLSLVLLISFFIQLLKKLNI